MGIIEHRNTKKEKIDEHELFEIFINILKFYGT